MAQPVTLIGVSLKGKNRIREHGDQWTLVRFGNPQCFGKRDAVFMESEATGHQRWILAHDDRDFHQTETST